jgi:uncharacterized membrane protein
MTEPRSAGARIVGRRLLRSGMLQRNSIDPRDETGSTLLLAIFYGAMALVVVLLVVAATSLYLERKRLFTLADGAALVGAEAFELSDVTVTDGSPHVTLEATKVATSVKEYVAANPLESVEDLRIEDASSPDGSSANVTLSAYWRPPVLTLLLPDGLRLEVTAVARSVFS